MIQPDARSRLTPEDVALVLTWIDGGRPSPEEVDLRLLEEDLDTVLDRPEVAAGLRAAPMPGPSPSLFFYVAVRHALVARGVTDRRMADYCAALLREFGRGDRAHRIAPVDDHRHEYLVDILSDASSAQGDRQFRVLVHLGNYALWFAGVFPERIAARRGRTGGPDLAYYDTLGGRGFAEASDHWMADRVGLGDVLRVAADRFGALRGALNAVSADLRLRAA
jgi:hypothetical protein